MGFIEEFMNRKKEEDLRLKQAKQEAEKARLNAEVASRRVALEQEVRIREGLKQGYSLYHPQVLEILKEVKDRVWKVGEILEGEEISLEGVSYMSTALVYRFPAVTTYSYGGGYSRDGSSGAYTGVRKGTKSTRLEIGVRLNEVMNRIIKNSYYKEGQVVLYCKAEHKPYRFTDGYQGAILGSTPGEKLANLKQVVAEDCWGRTQHNKLPLDLAREAKRELRERKL